MSSFEIRHVAETVSTQTDARQLDQPGIAIVADRQTGGYGTVNPSTGQRSKWRGDKGDLLMSFAVAADANLLTEMTFVTALAVRNALNTYISADQAEIFFSRPDDIHVRLSGESFRGKMAGIIVEKSDVEEGLLVAGVGVNLWPAERPKNYGKSFRPVSLSDCRPEFMPGNMMLARKLLKEFEKTYAQWQSEGLESIMRSMNLLPENPKDRQVTLYVEEYDDTPPNIVQGEFKGFDNNPVPGLRRMFIQPAGGKERLAISSNKVTFLPPGREQDLEIFLRNSHPAAQVLVHD